MSTIKTKKVQLGTDANSANNFTLYQPATPDGTLRIGVGNAENPTEVGQFNANGYKPTTAPLFRAYLSSSQAISNATFTKVACNATSFDTTSDFDTSNNRFVPSVAGYYLFHGFVRFQASSDGKVLVSRIYKNGSYDIAFEGSSNASNASTQITALIYMNGTTDYVEYYTYQNYGSTVNVFGGSSVGGFQGHLIQQA